jgi:beta-lactamase class A
MKTFVFVILAFILGFTGAYFWQNSENNSQTATGAYNIKALRSGQAGLINPLVEYELDSFYYKHELKNFEDEVRNLTNQLIKDGKVTNVAMYFRDLNNGPWFGINEDKKYFPASLLKLPVMMTYYKLAETQPEILNKTINYDEGYQKILGNYNTEQYFKSEKSIEPNKTYTVEELIEYMIVYSDNNAKNLLIINLPDPNDLMNIYRDLGVADTFEITGNTNIMSVHSFSSFFRVLYNASYLNKEMSKKILEMLAHSTFKRGLVSGLPENLTVAHKFGEHSNNNGVQLHDCGIIYYPQKPYLLCIMTQGTNFEKLEKAIEDISQLVYKEIDRQVIPTK